jgi:hypothetical protein
VRSASDKPAGSAATTLWRIHLQLPHIDDETHFRPLNSNRASKDIEGQVLVSTTMSISMSHLVGSSPAAGSFTQHNLLWQQQQLQSCCTSRWRLSLRSPVIGSHRQCRCVLISYGNCQISSRRQCVG